MIRLFTPLNLALGAILALTTIAGYLLVPPGAMLPVRWGLDLQPSQFAPKNWALLQMPAGVAIIWGLLWLAARFGNKDRQAQQARALEIIVPVLTGLLAVIQIAMVVIGMRSVPV